MSKQIKKISDIPASNQELQQTHKDIRKPVKLKERADPQKAPILKKNARKQITILRADPNHAPRAVAHALSVDNYI